MRSRIRELALILAVVTLAVSAGCSALSGGEPGSTDLRLTNQDGTSHAVVVEITEGGRLVYSAGRTVEAESGIDLSPFEETGEYEVAVSVDGETTEQSYTFEGDGTVNVGIADDGEVTVGA